MLEKLFIAIAILTILVGSSLAVVALSEPKEVSTEVSTKDSQQLFKIITISDDKISSEKDNSDDEYNYLIRQIIKLRKEVRAIPAVIAPGY